MLCGGGLLGLSILCATAKCCPDRPDAIAGLLPHPTSITVRSPILGIPSQGTLHKEQMLCSGPTSGGMRSASPLASPSPATFVITGYYQTVINGISALAVCPVYCQVSKCVFTDTGPFCQGPLSRCHSAERESRPKGLSGVWHVSSTCETTGQGGGPGTRGPEVSRQSVRCATWQDCKHATRAKQSVSVAKVRTGSPAGSHASPSNPFPSDWWRSDIPFYLPREGQSECNSKPFAQNSPTPSLSIKWNSQKVVRFLGTNTLCYRRQCSKAERERERTPGSDSSGSHPTLLPTSCVTAVNSLSLAEALFPHL